MVVLLQDHEIQVIAVDQQFCLVKVLIGQWRIADAKHETETKELKSPVEKRKLSGFF